MGQCCEKCCGKKDTQEEELLEGKESAGSSQTEKGSYGRQIEKNEIHETEDQSDKEEDLEDAAKELEELDELFNHHIPLKDKDKGEMTLTSLDKWFDQSGIFNESPIKKPDVMVHFTKIITANKKTKMSKEDFVSLIKSLSDEKGVPVSEIKGYLMKAGPPQMTAIEDIAAGSSAADAMESTGTHSENVLHAVYSSPESTPSRKRASPRKSQSKRSKKKRTSSKSRSSQSRNSKKGSVIKSRKSKR